MVHVAIPLEIQKKQMTEKTEVLDEWILMLRRSKDVEKAVGV